METESRLGLHGHERGNPGNRQGHDLTDHRASSRPYLERARGGQLPPTTRQKAYLWVCRSESEIALMRALKAVLDPKRILNPGKMF